MIERVAELLFQHGDFPDSIRAWSNADLKARAANTRKVVYTKGKAFAKLTLRAFRASGDRGTSCLNWLENFIAWSCIILPKPWEAVADPSREKFGDIIFRYFFEGDDSVVNTNSKMSREEIVDQWTSLGYNMKLLERQKGDPIVFVGMTTRVEDNGRASSCVMPEPNRNIAGCAWTTSGNITRQERRLIALTRSKMFEDYPPLAAYFAGIAEHWSSGVVDPDGALTEAPLERECQFKIYGDFNPNRRVALADFDVDLTRDCEAGRRVIEAYCGVTFTPAQENALVSLGAVGPDDRWVAHYFPREMLV